MESDTVGIPEKPSKLNKFALMVGGALFGAVGGFISLFFGFAVASQILPNGISGVVFLSVFYAPFVIWSGIWVVMAHTGRGHDSFPFFSGGVIGVLLFLLAHGLCFAALPPFR